MDVLRSTAFSEWVGGTTAIAAATRYFAKGTPPATRPALRALPQQHIQRRGHSPNPRLKGGQRGQWFATAGSAGAAGATCGGGGFTGQSWGPTLLDPEDPILRVAPVLHHERIVSSHDVLAGRLAHVTK